VSAFVLANHANLLTGEIQIQCAGPKTVAFVCSHDHSTIRCQSAVLHDAPERG